ncbi:MAG: WD40 repeat domain-containing protein [Anaerolineales bacterium]
MNTRLIVIRSITALTGLVVVGILLFSITSILAPQNTASPTAEPTSKSGVIPLTPTLPAEGIVLKTNPVPPGQDILSRANLEGLTELGHFGRGWPAAADFSPDGSRLAIGTSRGVEILSTADWSSAAAYPYASPVLAVLYSPDGKLLAAGLQDGMVLVLDAASGKTLHRLLWHSRPVHGLAFSGWRRDGQSSAYLASGAEDGSVAVWDLKSGLARHRLTNPLLGYWGYGIRSLAFSPDDSVLVTGGDQGYLSRWDLATGKELPRLQTQFGLLFSIAFSPDGSRLASACGDGTVQLWDYASGEPLVLLQGHAYGAWSVAWTSKGDRLASSAGDGMVKIWDPVSGTLLREKAATFTKIDSLKYSPDDTRLAAVSAGERAIILDARSLAETRTFPDMIGGIRSTAFFPGGEWSALSAENGMTYLWNFPKGEVIPLGNPRPASKADFSSEFSPRGGILAAADGLPGIVRLIDLETLAPRSEFRVMGVRALAFSPDGKTLAAGGNGVLLIADMESGENRTLTVPSRITSLAFVQVAEAGTLLLAGGLEDGSILVWDPIHPDNPGELSASGNSAVWSLAVSGSLLAAGDDRGDIRVWDMTHWILLRTLSGYMSSVFALTISPDGTLLAAGGIQGAIRFWSIQNGTLIRVIPAHNGWVNGLVFSPDGRWLLSGGSDGVGRIWGIPA